MIPLNVSTGLKKSKKKLLVEWGKKSGKKLLTEEKNQERDFQLEKKKSGKKLVAEEKKKIRK